MRQKKDMRKYVQNRDNPNFAPLQTFISADILLSPYFWHEAVPQNMLDIRRGL
jgi:hypothetical protein